MVKEAKAFFVDSEPGDCTRYRYYAIPDEDGCYFTAANSTIKYPHFVAWWHYKSSGFDPEKQDKQIELTDQMVEMSKEYECNPWTLRECLSFMRGIASKHLEEDDG